MTTHFDIIRTLCDNGFATYIVGGPVRDLLNDTNPSDIDIVTAASPDVIEQLFKHHDVRKVGKSFGVMLVDGFEVATFRHDRHNILLDARQTVVEYASTIDEDLSRRDLTVNAMALCELTGELVDNHGGVQDLKQGVIRFVGDPVQRILEDPNRIIRAARFLAKLKGTFDIPTLLALQAHAHLVKTHVAPDRIKTEVLKAMEVDAPSLFFSALHVIGALGHIFPSLSSCVGHEHGQHHSETVWEHVMIAGDSVSPKFTLVRLAAFLHDVGKPQAYADAEGTNFAGHEVIGAHLVREEMAALRFSNVEIDTVADLVRSHMWLGAAITTDKALRKALFRFAEKGISTRDWLRIRIADRKANLTKQPFTLADIKQRAKRIGIGAEVRLAPPKVSAHQLSVSGKQLIEHFGLTPGPVVGCVQKHLLSFLIEHGWENDTPEMLLGEASAFLKTL